MRIARVAAVVALLATTTIVVLLSAPAPSSAQVSPGRTVRVSTFDGGAEVNGDSHLPQLSADGRFVVFESNQPLTKLDTGDVSNVYREDRDPDGNGIFDEPGKTRTELVSVGVAQPIGALSCGPQLFSFPDTRVGDHSSSQSVTCTDVGSGPVAVTGVTINGSPTQFAPFDFCSGQTLKPNEQCTISFTFNPTTAGPKDSTVEVANSGSSPAMLSMFATTTGSLTCSIPGENPAGTFNFGNILTGSTTSVVLTCTAGGLPGERTSIQSAQIVSTNGAMSFGSTPPGGRDCTPVSGFAILNPGDSCVEGITFSPQTTISFTGTLTMGHNGANPSDVTHLTGNGASPGPRIVVNRAPASAAAPMRTTAATGAPAARSRRVALLPAAVGDAEPANADSRQPTISADGRFVAWSSAATNLVPDQFAVSDVGTVPDVFVRDMQAGQTFIVPNPARAQGAHTLPWLTGDAGRGLHLAFIDDEIGCEGQCRQVMVDDLAFDLATHTTSVPESLPASFDGDLDGKLDTGFVPNSRPTMSADGRYVAVAAVDNPSEPSFSGIVVYDRSDQTAVRLDVQPGAPSTPLSAVSVDEPAMSADGRFVVFELRPPGSIGTTNQPPPGPQQIVLADRDTDGDGRFGPSATPEPFADELVSRQAGAAPDDFSARGNGDSSHPAISADGRYIAFASEAPNLLNDDDGSEFDQLPDCEGPCDATLVRDRVGNGANELASVASFDPPQAAPSFSTPAISATGRYVAFDTEAGNLIPEGQDTQFDDDVFVREFLPELRPTPEPLNFGTVLIGDSSLLSVRLDHSGFGPLVVGQPSIAGAARNDFRVVASTCTAPLHEGDSCALAVRYQPTASGTRTATLVVPHDGSAAPTSVRLQGGAGPKVATLAFKPDTLTFSGQLGLTPSAPQTVTVSDTGNQRVRIDSTAIAGAQPGDFAVATDGCRGVTLSPGGSCAISLVFKPQGPGRRQAALQLTDTATGSPHLVGLDGSGTPPTVLANPGTGAASRPTTITGQGYPPNTVVTVQWADARTLTAGGFPEPAVTVTTNAAGAFTVTLVTFRSTPVGGRAVVATAGAFSANAGYLVGALTSQAPDFVSRG